MEQVTFMKKADSDFNEIKYRRLLLCLLIDGIGLGSYLIPAIGEFSDIIWAPLSGMILFFMFGGKTSLKSYLGGIGELIEEIIPGTDFIPTASLLWAYTYMFNKEKTYKNFLDKQEKQHLLTLNTK